MARRYAKGSRAWGHCSRTGDRVLVNELVRDGDTGLLVTREAWEPEHPQERVVDVFDPQILRRRAPDLDSVGIFTTATFTWDPGEIADGATEVKSDIVVDGALFGATVIVYPGVDLAGMVSTGYINSPGKVGVVIGNFTGDAVNLASSTWQVLITQELYTKGSPLYTASFPWDPIVLADGTLTTKVVTVIGAAIGDAVLVYPAQSLNGLLVSGYVSAADTVTVVLLNLSGAAVEIGSDPWPLWSVVVAPGSIGAGKFFSQDSLYASFSWNPGSIADGATETTTATVTGAAVGDAVILYPGVNLAGLIVAGYVSAADTITAVLFNFTGDAIDLASSSWAARVIER